MVAAAGMGMGTPFQRCAPIVPLHPAGHMHVSGASLRGVVPPPTGNNSSGTPVGEILDAMGTPHAALRGVQDDIERHSSGGGRNQDSREWNPPWLVFAVKAFRGRNAKHIFVQSAWDDEQLLIALKKAYNDLRVWYQKWFSLRSLGYITRVKVNEAFIYPQRIGPGRTTHHRNMRMRYLLDHPHHMRGKHDFMRVLTESSDYGIEFVERWNMTRVCVLVVGSALLSLSIALMYGVFTKDWSAGFQIASFFSQTFAQIFVLVGCVEYQEF
ncbi:hypothetical protein BD414DRAFT_474817 [Trametes punicea]|nr:hypothetical protein BD414DRAFT_474817 [Trametes punicea]